MRKVVQRMPAFLRPKAIDTAGKCVISILYIKLSKAYDSGKKANISNPTK